MPYTKEQKAEYEDNIVKRIGNVFSKLREPIVKQIKIN